MELWFALQEEQPVRFAFTDSLLSDAADTVCALKAMNIEVELLSGDRQPAVRRAAGALGIENWHAETRPDGKVAHLNELKAAGHRVLMVGDGINDAPALDWVSTAVEELQQAEDTRLLSRTTAFGYYDHNFIGLIEHRGESQIDGGDHSRQRIWRVRAKRVVLATGATWRRDGVGHGGLCV